MFVEEWQRTFRHTLEALYVKTHKAHKQYTFDILTIMSTMSTMHTSLLQFTSNLRIDFQHRYFPIFSVFSITIPSPVFTIDYFNL